MDIKYTVKYHTDKKVSDINKEWGGKFIETLNAANAGIVFALGLTKEGKVRMCITADLPPKELKKVLEGVIVQLSNM